MPKVSVVMAVGPDAPVAWLKEAMDSLEAQTFRDFEVLQQREPGPWRARNEGAKRASGEYLAVMDSDDICLPTRLEKEVKLLDADADLAVVGGWALCFGRMDKAYRHPERLSRASFLPKNRIVDPSSMLRRSVAMPYGPWRDRPWPDYDLWCRMAANGVKMRNIEEFFILKREHEHNDSRRRPFLNLLHGELSARWQLLGLSRPA